MKPKPELGFLGSNMHVHAEAYAYGSTAYVRIIWLTHACRMHACMHKFAQKP